MASGTRTTCAPVTPQRRSGMPAANRCRSLRRATKLARAGAHMAIGTIRDHAGDVTVQPIDAVRTAMALVVPMAIAKKASNGPGVIRVAGFVAVLALRDWAIVRTGDRT